MFLCPTDLYIGTKTCRLNVTAVTHVICKHSAKSNTAISGITHDKDEIRSVCELSMKITKLHFADEDPESLRQLLFV